MASDEHGLTEVTCPQCNGHGEVLEAVTVVHDDGTIETQWVAKYCSGCGGEGTRWV